MTVTGGPPEKSTSHSYCPPQSTTSKTQRKRRNSERGSVEKKKPVLRTSDTKRDRCRDGLSSRRDNLVAGLKCCRKMVFQTGIEDIGK